MESLKELLKIVNRKRLSKIDVFDQTFLKSDNTNLYYKLYQGIESGKINTDTDAALYLYGSDEKDAKYRKLKSRFKNKLIKTILLLNRDELFNNELGKVYYECISNYQSIEILIKITGYSKIMFELIKDEYSICVKFKFYEILTKYSFYLCSYYSLNGQAQKYEEENTRFLVYSEKSSIELKLKQTFNSIIVLFTSSRSITDILLEKVKLHIQEIENKLNLIDNMEIFYFYYYAQLLYDENLGDLSKIIKLSNEIEILLKNNMYINNNNRNLLVLLYRLKAYLHTKDFRLGIKLLYSNTSIIVNESDYNWFVLKEFEFKLYLHDNKIKEANEVYEIVMANKFFKRHIAQLTEKWKIHYAYLVFMDNYLNNGNYKFSLAKFINEVPINSRDKGGYNFAIRLVELLYHFARKEYNIIFQKMESLKSYKTRYLNDNTYKRNHIFLALLLKAEKEGFDGKAMSKATWTEIVELRKLNTYIIAEWEIMPFDVIWDMMVDLAKR